MVLIDCKDFLLWFCNFASIIKTIVNFYIIPIISNTKITTPKIISVAAIIVTS